MVEIIIRGETPKDVALALSELSKAVGIADSMTIPIDLEEIKRVILMPTRGTSLERHEHIEK